MQPYAESVTSTSMEEDVLLKLPAYDNTMEEGSIDDYSSSHKSIREEPSDSITARKKQRIEEEKTEEEEEEEGYNYDSSDSEGETEDKKEITDEEKEKAMPDYSVVPFVQLFDVYGVEITDDDLLNQMRCSGIHLYRKRMLLPKIRRYLKSISESEGFECEHFPGFISGITSVAPRQFVIELRDRYPEAYGHVMYLSKFVLKDYNKKWSTEFVVLAVNNVNAFVLFGYRYKLTFTAASGGRKETFQADVYFEPNKLLLEVKSCDIKPSGAEVSNPTHSDSFLGEEPSDKSIAGNEISDPVEMILTLMRLGDDELLDKIKNNCPPAMNQDMLLKKVRKYFQSVVESEGFKCSYFPGHIPSITYLRPREKLIDNMNCHVEGYHHLTIMSQLALDYYFKDKGSEHGYLVVRVINASLWKRSNCSYTYYLTFDADSDPDRVDYDYAYEKFQAKVHDNHHDMDVLFCRKLNT